MLFCIAGKNDISVNVLQYILKYYKHDKNLKVVCILNKNESGTIFKIPC